MTKIITFQPFREAKDDAGTAAGDQCDEAKVISHGDHFVDKLR